MGKIAILLIIIFHSMPAAANALWYSGKINRIWPYAQDGGFIITFESPSSLSDCKYGYAYFRSDLLQTEKMKNSISLALSAFHTNSTVGVIIDKGAPDELCFASDIDIRK